MTDIKETTTTTAAAAPKARTVDMKLEIVVIPVSDVDRAKRFYGDLGWRLDADFAAGDDYRVIQFTPPGSGCSVIFGKNVTAAAPGSAQGLYLIVSDIEAARDDLLRRGVEVSDVFHGGDNVYAGTDEPYLFGRVRVDGPDPDRGSYRSFASFSDPDGNGWLFQEVTTRLPGRIDSNATSFASAEDLKSAMWRAAVAHGEHEKRTGGQRDENWPDWYAAYMVANRPASRCRCEAAAGLFLHIELKPSGVRERRGDCRGAARARDNGWGRLEQRRCGCTTSTPPTTTTIQIRRRMIRSNLKVERCLKRPPYFKPLSPRPARERNVQNAANSESRAIKVIATKVCITPKFSASRDTNRAAIAPAAMRNVRKISTMVQVLRPALMSSVVAKPGIWRDTPSNNRSISCCRKENGLVSRRVDGVPGPNRHHGFRLHVYLLVKPYWRNHVSETGNEYFDENQV